MIFQIKAYLGFLIKSTNEHGVHSPFVFDLVTKCFYDRNKYSEYIQLNKYRKSLLANKDNITITDFGAGSRVFSTDKRQISRIAKNAGISAKRAALLYRISRYFKPNNVLELGTSLGLSTSALYFGSPQAKLITLEGCPNTLAVAKSQFDEFTINQKNIDFVNTEFSTYLKKPEISNQKFDLIYFDGNHSKEATLEYFRLLLPTVTNDSVWIFDDIYWSKSMSEAWEEIKKNEKVKVTIDTHQWGLVFFRREQEKEHFTIRV